MDEFPLFQDSRSKIIRALATVPGAGVNLRTLRELSGSGMRSTQLVLAELRRKKIVRVKKTRNQHLYSLNPRSPSYSYIVAMISLWSNQILAARALAYSAEAKKIFNFIASADSLFDQVQ